MHILHLALIRTSDAILTFHSFDTADLDRQVAAHCREWWAEHMDGEPLPSTDAEIIEAYFDNDGHGEWMDREEIDLAATAPLPAPSPRETSTILAALRYWQQDLDANEDPPISEHFHDHAPLTSEEIDTLCEALNFPDPKSEIITNFLAAYQRWNDREEGGEDDLHHAARQARDLLSA